MEFPIHRCLYPLAAHFGGACQRLAACSAVALAATSLALAFSLSHAHAAAADLCYRGWLHGERGPLAVLSQDGRDLVVAVGEAVDADWSVIAIDATSVELENKVRSLRRKLWFGGGTRSSSGAPSPNEEARLQWNAPTSVEPGSTFSVVLIVPGLDLSGGEFTLDYDPKVLAIADAIGGEEDYGGHARLPVRAGGGDYLAEVTFDVVARDPVTTQLRIEELALIGQDGEQLSVPRADPLVIRVARQPPPQATGQTGN